MSNLDQGYDELIYMDLKPPQNLRRVYRRCCANCKWIANLEGSMMCRRPQGPTFDTGDGNYLWMVCDRWGK